METETTDDKPKSNALMLWATLSFFVGGVVNLLEADWLFAALFFTGGSFYLFDKRIERLPRAVRYLIVAVFAALTVAVVVKFILDVKARR
ncbi:MAG TPA: hypothetical protein VHU19_16855 [Pyrinomonadaceae bacterium]|jgi:hypothetical protein|nr:hypothetical protein [Pyrinomonadaceae bacterium]